MVTKGWYRWDFRMMKATALTLTTSPLGPAAPAAPGGPGIPRGPGRPGAPATPGRPWEGKRSVVNHKATDRRGSTHLGPLKSQQQVWAIAHSRHPPCLHPNHILTAAPLAPARPLAPGFPYRKKKKKKGEKDQLIEIFVFFFDPSFTLSPFHKMRLMTVATYRRSNGARETWKTYFTTGTGRTRRTRVTNRSNFTLKEGKTLGY